MGIFLFVKTEQTDSVVVTTYGSFFSSLFKIKIDLASLGLGISIYEGLDGSPDLVKIFNDFNLELIKLKSSCILVFGISAKITTF